MMDMIQEDNTNIKPELLPETNKPSTSAVDVETNKTSGGSDGGSKETRTEEILKELRKVKRQNSITHWLLAIMIVLTATWQLSEVSLLLKVKNKLTNPFKSVGKMLTGAQDALKHFDGNESDAALKDIQPPFLPPIKIPDLPYMDLPVLGRTDVEK
ncbi:Ddi1 [Thalictrum thalictroides]|uniref:Ddi1 n=1 Tax=Thalictrum thalictroides TaxID=46969 RepID=A0A7J6VFX1_THATH|nr:Ddi1 [Thalictrum thalictroides]